MHNILFNESFFFCPRSDLESLQLVRKSLLQMIVKSSRVPPLRRIHCVILDSYDTDDRIKILAEEPVRVHEPDYEASILDGDFAETFRRLQ